MALVALVLCGLPSAVAAEAWQPGEEMAKDADLLPSASQAAAVLARRVGDVVRNELEAQQSLDGGRAFVEVWGSAPAEVKQVVCTLLAESVAPASVGAVAGGRPAIRVTVDLLGDPKLSAATLHATVSAERSLWTTQVAFMEKPWADRPAEYLSRRAQRDWVIAWSQRPAASMEEALHDARSAAAGQLLDGSRGRGDGRAGQRPTPAMEQLLLKDLLAEVQPGRLQADQFVQGFQRPYGKVWRAGVLVDGSPNRLVAIARRASDQIAAHEARRRGVLFAVTGVSVVICLTYALLNLLTRGYFTGRLRAAAVVVLVAAIVLLLSAA
jgi:hypothetical protein